MINVHVRFGRGVEHYRGMPCWLIQTAGPIPDLIARLKGTGLARWSKSPKIGWMIPASPESALRLTDDLIVRTSDYFWNLCDEFQDAYQKAQWIEEVKANTEDLPDIPAEHRNPELTPWRHQRRGFHLIGLCPHIYLDWDMGTGKTLPVVAAVNAMDDIQRVAVFCPPSVTYVWGAEFLKHTPKETGWLVEFMSDKRSWGSPDQPRGSVLVANAKTVTKRVDRARDVSSVCHALNRKFVVVFNYQVMYRNDVKAFLNEGSWDLIVYDEAHCIKKPGGVQSKTAKEFRKVSRRRVCLSGTPMDKPHDIYAQARALDPAIFGDNFQRFKHRYPFDGVVTFDMDQHGFKVTGDYAITRRIMNFPKGDRGWRGSYWWVRHGFSQAARLCLDFNDVSVSTTDAFRLACDNLKCDEYTRLTTVDMAAARAEFQQKLGRFMDKVRAEDVLTLPECTQAFRKVELGNKAARIYRDLHKHLYAEVQADGVEGVIRAGNPLAKLMRLQQVTSGCIPLIPRATFENLDDVDWQYVDDAKETALGEFLEGLSPDECVVAFTRFKTDLEAVERVAGKLGRKVAFIRGGRNDIGHKWTDDPSTEAGQATVAAVQVQAGGVGIDLTRARYAWFHSLSWSGPEFSQAMKRIHRHGQDRPVTIMHCVASGTVDEQIYEALAAKKEVVDHVLGALVRPEDLA